MLRSELREGKIVRALPEDVEAVLETMFRTAERTKGWIRDYFVAGLSAVEIADRDGVPRQQVATVMRLFGQKLSARASPTSYVQVTLSLPLSLSQELQALADEIGKRGSKKVAEKTLKPVISAVIEARKKLAT
jgi:predicted DNA-binding protein YlxM (UPF0122 family)